MSMSAATTFSSAYTSNRHLFKMHPVIPCRSFQVVQAALSLLYSATFKNAACFCRAQSFLKVRLSIHGLEHYKVPSGQIGSA